MSIPLNVAYIDITGELGGAEHLLLNLLSLLPRDKIVPILFCGGDGVLSREAKKLGIQTEIIKTPKLYSTSWVWGNKKIINPFALLWNFASLIISALQIRQRIKNLRIDIIQTNTIPAHISGGLAARSLGIQCIWYFHDLVETQRLAGFMVILWRLLAHNLSNWIVAVSQAVLDNLSVSTPGRVIYAGVLEPNTKDHQFNPSLYERLHIPVTSILVGSLGRIAYAKGLDVLIEAADMVVKQNQDIHFVIFGGVLFGEKKYKTKLEKKVYQYDLTKNWHWMGYDEYAKEYLKEMDFLVFPSRREALPLSVIEAGMSGKAVIATCVGGIPEIIENGKTGIIVPPENAQQLATEIINLANDPQLAIKMGETAKMRVRTLFDNTRYLNEFLDFYMTVCNFVSSSST